MRHIIRALTIVVVASGCAMESHMSPRTPAKMAELWQEPRDLAQRNLLDANGKLHVDVLKVPHHGAEFNMSTPFAQAVTADDYIFCGNGFATNPEFGAGTQDCP